MSLTIRPIQRVLSRPNLLMGSEREPALLAALVTGGVALSSMTIVAFVVCGAVWGLSLWLFRWMAKADPYLTKIYQRSLKYRGYYPAFSRPYRVDQTLRDRLAPWLFGALWICGGLLYYFLRLRGH